MADRKLTVAAAAKLANVQPPTWRGYVNRGHAPQPDGREELSGTPWWWESTVRAWKKKRPGRGSPGRPRKKAA